MVHSESHWFKPNTCCHFSAGKRSVPAANESRRWSALHSSIGSRGTAPHPAFCLLFLSVLTYWSSVINYSYSRFSLPPVRLSCQLSVHFAGHAVGLCWLFCGRMFWSCSQRLMLFFGRMFWSCYQSLLAVLWSSVLVMLSASDAVLWPYVMVMLSASVGCSVVVCSSHAIRLCWLFCGRLFWSCYQPLMLFCGRMFWSCYRHLMLLCRCLCWSCCQP